MTHAIEPGAGFADPVFQSQTAFRAILAALSEPGTIHQLDADIETPEGLHPASAIVLLTLADYETPIWLAAAGQQGAAGGWLRFHAACPLTPEPADAAFAVLSGAAAEPKLAAFLPRQRPVPGSLDNASHRMRGARRRGGRRAFRPRHSRNAAHCAARPAGRFLERGRRQQRALSARRRSAAGRGQPHHGPAALDFGTRSGRQG